MKKHSAWQKDRNRVRRLSREVQAIIRRDDARAEWFNNRFAVMQEKARRFGSGNFWYINEQYPASEWPKLDDMFIEVVRDCHSNDSNSDVPDGLYVVRGVEWGDKYDKLLSVTEVNTGRDELLWFPRMGHRVVSCGEVGETPWLG